jgi:hypothetical protein
MCLCCSSVVAATGGLRRRKRTSPRADHNPPKSSGTLPNFLITSASLKSPVAGSPVRLNATAPTGLPCAKAPQRASQRQLLIDCNGDGLDMLVAPPLTRGQMPDLGQRFDPRRVVGRVGVVHHLRGSRVTSSDHRGLCLWTPWAALS